MKLKKYIFPLAILVFASLLLTGCPENTRVPGLQESVQARDMALESTVVSNIQSDLELRWYTQTYGIEVIVSHAVATVTMKVKTEDQATRALALAEGTDGVSEVINEIEVDPSLDEAPFDPL